MGLEARCAATYQGKRSEGKALLETEELVFRGEFRFTAPFREMREVRADSAAGEVRVLLPDGEAVLELGPQAARWAERILNPKSRIDKLGVQPGDRVCLVDFADTAFAAELEARGAALVEGGEGSA